MSKTLLSIIVVVVVVLGGYFMLRGPSTPTNTDTDNTTQASILGCYVAKLAQDVYTLNIQSENNGAVAGTLEFKNFEKDSSHGPFTGTYKSGILLGDYSFDSEGMHSVRQVVFKKQGNSFVEGFGPVTVVNDRETFTDLSNITYDPKLTFVLSPTCK